MLEDYNKLIEAFVNAAITLRKPMSISLGDFTVTVNLENTHLKWCAHGLKTFKFTSRPGPSEFNESLFSILWTLS